MNIGIDASSLRTEVDSQNRQYSVKYMLSGSSPTTEHYDMFATDNEEEARQDQIDSIEREQEKQNSPVSDDVSEYATNIRAAAERFAPSSSSTGAGSGRGAEQRRDRSEPDAERGLKRGPKFDSVEVKEAKAKAKAKAKVKPVGED
eukprot:8050432-Heterocapsa_arctica.AAC.1